MLKGHPAQPKKAACARLCMPTTMQRNEAASNAQTWQPTAPRTQQQASPLQQQGKTQLKPLPKEEQ